MTRQRLFLVLLVLIFGTLLVLFRIYVPAGDTPPPATVPHHAAAVTAAHPTLTTYTRLKLIFAGDVMLDRGVERSIAQRGPEAVLHDIKPYIQNADFAFCNLESPLSLEGVQQDKEINFQADSLLSLTIGEAGFDVVSVANNHISDYGAQGLQVTITALEVAGIGHCGAGPSLAEAMRPCLVERRGIKIATVAFCEPFWGVAVAGDEQAGIAPTDTDVIVKAITRANGLADVVIASFHWDWEYNHRPDEETMLLAQLAARSGADIIVGHHQHVVQGVQLIGQVPVAYSLGNFVFDQKPPERRENYLLAVELMVAHTPEGVTVYPVTINIIPLEIDPATNFPALPASERQIEIAGRISELSYAFGTITEKTDDGSLDVSLTSTQVNEQ